MKNTALALLACVLAACSKPAVGLWGGKWNDDLPVFVKITPGTEPGTYSVRCDWLQKPDASRYFGRTLRGLEVDGRIEARWLILKVKGDAAMLYGGLNDPMMANLVRLKDKAIPSPEDAEAALLRARWKPGAIPPAEALAKLMSK